MSLKRGDMVLVDFPFRSGTGAKRRPALVIQNDRDNRRLVNVIIAAISGPTHRTAREPTQFFIDVGTTEGKQSRLAFDSAVTCENIATIEKRLVHGKIGTLPASLMNQADACLKAALALK